MKLRKLVRVIGVLLFLTRCAVVGTGPVPTGTTTEIPIMTATPTPDPCTGWWCSITGTVYAESTQPGNVLEGVTITRHQTSYCSSTRGEQQTVTGADGGFELDDIFFHDTDRVLIRFEAEGYETEQWDSVDIYCLYCSCFSSPLAIVLQATAEP